MGKLFIVNDELSDWVFKVDIHNQEFHWDTVSPPKDSDIVYHMSLEDRRVKSIRSDYWVGGVTPAVSKYFLEVCSFFSVNYKAPAIKFDLNGQMITDYFYYLLPCDFVSIVDLEKSEYVFDTDRNTGEAFTVPSFPSIYCFERIDRLVINSTPKPDFFRAIEIGEYVCTDRFKEEVERRKLKGIKFTEITDDFTYKAFGVS